MMLKKKGFTLVELLVVISIISILVVMVLIAINPIRVIEDTRDSKNRSEMNQLKSALQLHYNELNRYPDALGGLTPNYIRVLPSVTGDDGFAYVVDAVDAQDYDAVVDMNNVTGVDTASVTKCSTDGALATAGVNSYMICPD